MLLGRCHCNSIQLEMPDQVAASSVCYCDDCRKQSGAPMVAWAMVPEATVSITGKPTVYNSSEGGRRSFCGSCGTGLFFSNALLAQMGMMQVRIAALDDPNAIPPQMQVQTAERVKWMESADELPAFERFPG
ncbi:GFA family protein [Methylobacterium sp. E-005]|uniref:GFA family protein n=1 Tax=Methylobacterium sp. E-005 TaxID=2836549 RepID=UPI0028C45DD1|nr:GFA family protein [Methylobacterium sp. E-005]